jgi:hypothetical protein
VCDVRAAVRAARRRDAARPPADRRARPIKASTAASSGEGPAEPWPTPWRSPRITDASVRACHASGIAPWT